MILMTSFRSTAWGLGVRPSAQKLCGAWVLFSSRPLSKPKHAWPSYALAGWRCWTISLQIRKAFGR